MSLLPARKRKTDATRIEPRYIEPAAAGRRRGARWRVVIPGGAVDRPPPIAHGSRQVDLTATLRPRLPDLGVLELPRGQLVGPHGWARTASGELVNALTFFGPDASRLRLPDRPLRVKRLDGVCLSLSSDWSRKNYGHFLLDGIGRWELFHRAGHRIEDVDHVYCCAPHPRAARFLERLGIPDEKLVSPRKHQVVAADRILAASYPGARHDYPPWLVEFLRSLLPRPAEPATRRLYVPRATTRRVTNEDALLPILAERGFEVYEPAEHADPPADFARAEAVVGAHGAGLTDIVFCPPGARLLELLPSDHVNAYWYTLATAAGLRYGYLVGPSAGDRGDTAHGPSPHDFAVDPTELQAALDWAVG